MMSNFTFYRLLLLVIFLPVFALSSLGQASDDGCSYELHLTDRYGDGWGSNTISLWVNGEITFDKIKLANGSGPEIHSLNLQSGDLVKVQVNAVSNNYPDEIKWEIFDALGKSIAHQGTGVYDFPEVNIEALCPAPIDMAVVELLSPMTGNGLGAEEVVKLKLKNNGTEPLLSDFDVSYSINDVEFTETVTGQNIQSGDFFEYAFTTKADLSEEKFHNFSLSVNATDDGFEANDALSTEVYHGEAYELFMFDYANEGLYTAELPILEARTELIAKEALNHQLNAMCHLVDGNIYGLSLQDSLICIHPETLEVESLGKIDQSLGSVKDMAYDLLSRNLYVLAKKDSKTHIYALDLASLRTQKIKSFDENFVSMEIDLEGKFFMMNEGDKKLVSYTLASDELVDIVAIDQAHLDNQYENLVLDQEADKLYFAYNKSADKAANLIYIDQENSNVHHLGQAEASCKAKMLISKLPAQDGAYFLAFGSGNQKNISNLNFEDKTIDLTLFYGEDPSVFIPKFVCNQGVVVKSGETVIENGVTAIDASGEVELTLVKGDLSETWTLRVVVGKNHKAQIESFSIVDQLEGFTINEEDALITGFIESSVDLSTLTAQFTLSENAIMQYQGITQISNKSVVDFSKEVSYSVFAEDGSEKIWYVQLVNLTPPGPAALADDFNASIDRPTIMNINWANVPKSASYKIYYGETLTDEAQLEVEKSEVILTDLEPFTTYQLKIVPSNASGDCPENEVYSFTTGMHTIQMQTATLTVTEEMFYDEGVEGDYSDDSNFVLTLLPATAGQSVRIDFLDYYTESDSDEMIIYNGNSVDAPKIAGSPFSAYQLLGQVITADNPEGALTIAFTSDASMSKRGWKAKISLHEWIDYDVELVSIDLPASSYTLGEAEHVSFEIKNVGKKPLTQVVANFLTNSDPSTMVSQTFALETPLEPGAKLTLSKELDFSDVKTYKLAVNCITMGDSNTGDNTKFGFCKHTSKFELPTSFSFEDTDAEEINYYAITTDKVDASISDQEASLGEHAFVFAGNSYSGWSGPWNNNHWTINTGHNAQLVMHVDATTAANMIFSFDLKMKKKSYSLNNYARITVNGEMVGETILPESQYNDIFRSFKYDLSAHIGDIVKVVIEVKSKDEADQVWIDNIQFVELSPQDVELVQVGGLNTQSGNSANEIAMVSIKNTGSQPINALSLEAVVDGDMANKVSKSYTLASPLAPEATTELELAGIDLSAMGNHQVIITAVLTDDGNLDNNSSEVNLISKPLINTFPFHEDFEGENYWTVGGIQASWELGTPQGEMINSAGGGEKSWITRLDGTYNPNEFSWIESPAFDFSGISSPTLEVKTWWDMAYYKYASIAYSIDKGATWAVLGEKDKGENWYNRKSYSGESYWYGSGNEEWVVSKYSEMSALKGQSNVIFRVVFKNEYASLGGDGFAFDDFKIIEKAAVDAAIVSIEEPSDLNKVGEFKPKVTVANYGVSPLTTQVTMSIQPGDISVSKAVTALAEDETLEIEFDTFDAVSGEYNLTFSVEAADDVNAENNSMTTIMKLNQARFTSFRLNYASEAIIDTLASTVWLEAFDGANLANLKPIFNLNSYASAKIGALPQISGNTENDFTNPVVYTVVAPDGTEKEWTATIDPFKEKGNDFISFLVADQIGETFIDAENKHIYAELPYGVDRTALVVDFFLSENATAKVGETIQISTETLNDYSVGPVEYAVVSEFGVEEVWTVEINDTPNPTAILISLTADMLTETPVVVNADEKTMQFELEYHADLTQVKPIFTLSELAELYKGESLLVSNETIVDFTEAVELKVLAEDGIHTDFWTINMAKEAPATIASLSDIQINEKTIEGFASDVYEYNINLAAATTETPVVVALVDQEQAVVSITPATNVNSDVDAERTTSIVVVAEDGVSTITYSIKFYVLSADADLSDLKVAGTSIEGFAADQTAYSYSIKTDVSETPIVTAVLNNDKAEVMVTPAVNVYSDVEADRTTLVKITAEDGTEKEYTILFKVTVGLDELTAFGDFRVYPNPCQGKFNIDQIEAETIQIFNVRGDLIQNIEMNSNAIQINLEGNPSGIYTVKMIQKGFVHHIKVVLN